MSAPNLSRSAFLSHLAFARCRVVLATAAACGLPALVGCSHGNGNVAEQGAPPPVRQVVLAGDPEVVHLPHPEQFPTVQAAQYQAIAALSVTGVVQPDPSQEIPVISVANGRVVAIHVRLGDYVRKGQLIFEVQSTDISGAYDQYLKAVNDERLARTVLERDQLLYSKGAIAKSELEIAADTEQDALADLRAAEQQLAYLGVDKNNPAATVKVYSPASGFIVQQNITNASSAGNGISGTPNAFVIADLSHVWVICDVYENDIAKVHPGQPAQIVLAAYPNRPITGTVGEIDAQLDPTLHTAKVRIQVPNPGFFMRIGMFATATVHSRVDETYAAVPSTAVLHLHDRDWVYVPAGNGDFRRVGVVTGQMLPGDMQVVTQGVTPGQAVVRNALVLQNTAAQ